MKPITTFLAAAVGLALPACAQGQATQPAPCSSAGYHQFDFWLGDWEVTDPDGNFQGTNSITREDGGCLLVERWISANGNTGQSYNYYNPLSDEWRQVWVNAGGIIDYTGGLTETGSMRLEGTITPQAGTGSFPFTGEWTANEDGSVTQHFQQQDPETGEWQDWFIGIYRHKEG